MLQQQREPLRVKNYRYKVAGVLALKAPPNTGSIETRRRLYYTGIDELANDLTGDPDGDVPKKDYEPWTGAKEHSMSSIHHPIAQKNTTRTAAKACDRMVHGAFTPTVMHVNLEKCEHILQLYKKHLGITFPTAGAFKRHPTFGRGFARSNPWRKNPPWGDAISLAPPRLRQAVNRRNS